VIDLFKLSLNPVAEFVFRKFKDMNLFKKVLRGARRAGE
jgi:hypothetical protein